MHVYFVNLFYFQRITKGSGRREQEPLHISFEYDLLESSSIAWEIPSVITSVKPNITVFISPSSYLPTCFVRN